MEQPQRNRLPKNPPKPKNQSAELQMGPQKRKLCNRRKTHRRQRAINKTRTFNLRPRRLRTNTTTRQQLRRLTRLFVSASALAFVFRNAYRWQLFVFDYSFYMPQNAF